MSKTVLSQGGPPWKRWDAGGSGFAGLIKSAALGWIEHGATEMAAAISYYAVFSLAPLLVIAVAIAGAMFGGARARQEVVSQFGSMVGEQGGQLVGTLIDNASKPQVGVPATVLGILMLIVAAGGAFGQLKKALDRIWEVRNEPGAGARRFLRRWVLSFVMVLVVAFLLLGRW
jgi:membrane protein